MKQTASVGKKVLAYDLGGTKVALGIVDRRGKVLEEVRVPAKISEGKAAVLKQLGELGREMIARHPEVRRVGIASAGPLDPKRGLLLDPTNFSSPKGNWGKVPLARLLAARLDREVFLENDAAAAILAEHWVGAAKGYSNAMILTLGTGLGTGIVIDDKLVRAGRSLHPEAGHVVLNYDDSTAPCGCGNYGCAEAYLSGRNFSRRARVRFGNANLNAKDIAELARKRDPRAVAAFDEYARVMATAIASYAVIYAPEIIVFTGSFAEAADLFLKDTRRHLDKLLERRRVGVDLMPKLQVSTLKNNAGLVGGAYVALNAR